MSVARKIAEPSRPVHLDSMNGLMTSFGEIARAWLADVERTRRPKTLQAYEIALDKFFEVVPEARTRFIVRADLLRFRDRRAESASVLSANRDLKALKACLNWAWTNELPHPQVPLKRLLMPTPARRDVTLVAEEIERVLQAAQFDTPVLVVLRLCHGTGFRLGEAINLTWSDVNAQEGSISVTAKPWWQPKTSAAVRTVFAPDLVAWLLRYQETLRFRGEGDRVCQMDPRRGKPWSTRIHERLRAVYVRAGVAGKKPTHSLRHTLATELVQAGVPIHVAQKHLGHASASVTLGIYAHAQRSGLQQAGEALERFRGRGPR